MDNLPTRLPTQTITLDPPIFYNGKNINSLTLREPDMGELIDSYAELQVTGVHPDAATYNQKLHVMSKVSGVPKAALRLMSQAEFKDAHMILLGFTIGGPEDGKD